MAFGVALVLPDVPDLQILTRITLAQIGTSFILIDRSRNLREPK
jgi:hypothetical protein